MKPALQAPFAGGWILAITLLLAAAARAADSGDSLTLWYRQPATNWNSSLPIGNGRLGAMIFGGVEREHLQLNEDTLWAGGPYDPANTNALAALPEVRRLIFAGQFDAAAGLIASNMMAKPLWQMPYETVGDLFLEFPTNATVENYRRDLNLDTAVATISYQANGVHFKREMFASPVDQVIVVRLTADRPGQISFTARMDTPQRAAIETENGDTLVMSGTNGSSSGIAGALKYQARVRVLAKGGMVLGGEKMRPLTIAEGGFSPGVLSYRAISLNSINVIGADSATLLIAVATSYKNFHDVSDNPESIARGQIAIASIRPYKKLLAAHIAEHQRLFRRVELNLGETDAMKLPTDERITHFADGNDPQLADALFPVWPLSADFQFAPRRPAREFAGPLE